MPKKPLPKRRKALPAKPAPARAKPHKRKAAAPRRAAGVKGDATASLNLLPRVVFPLQIDPRLFQREAMRFAAMLRNRRRWTGSASVQERHAADAQSTLIALGIDGQKLDAIAAAGVVEVDIPYTSEPVGWELRVFPWEFALAAATRDRRRDGEFAVVRRLHRLEREPAAHRRSPTPMLHVESAPGRLRKEYIFSSERQLVESLFPKSASSTRRDYHRLVDPAREELEATVREIAPGSVHLSGFDGRQGARLLEPDGALEEPRDGYLLRTTGRGTDVVEPMSLGGILCAAPSPPLVVGCNFFNSGSRVAAMCVGAGAEAAIGFQDSFDDGLAELFFASFYRAWMLSGGNTTEAFRFAWTAVRSRGRSLRGTGVILWNARSILDPLPGARAGAASRAAGLPEQIDARLRKESKLAVTPENVRDLIGVTVEPIPRLNYSILHNNGPLFTRFTLFKKDARLGRVTDLRINVELHVGTDTHPFRMNAALEELEPNKELTDDIRVSLASALGRGIRESVHTSLFVEVVWRDVPLHRDTHRVTLLPVDEWRDDDENRMWLPSFVLPRDPAVSGIIASAQRYLMSLRDDSTAGFDGYQSVESPQGDPADACEAVDMQVRAIWSALLHETPLYYINPPPTFTQSSQRLRTPSDVIQSRRGTCIDLALLLASCLEYVEIHPAIILLTTHAFPAYWRHESYHEEFREAKGNPEEIPAAASASAAAPASVQRYSWYLPQPYWSEVVRQVQAGRLVPLETVWLTQQGGFAEAIEEGMKNLGGRREFDSLIDVNFARTDDRTPVTPLPMSRNEA